MKQSRKRLLAALACAAMLLTGCQSGKGVAVHSTLPPPEAAAVVPQNDTQQTAEQTVLLYLPSRDSLRLAAVPETAHLSISRHSAESLCQLLFAHPGNEQVSPLGADVQLSGTQPVEVSGEVATVSLAASALRLSHEELFTVCQAIANTLCQFGDVQYVNVLINGVQPGLDVAAKLPAGCFQENTRDDLNTLWNRAAAGKTASRHTITAALYYPAAGARGVVSEARALSFDGLEEAQVLRTLLSALYEGPHSLQGLPRYPDFSEFIVKEPAVIDDSGTKRAVLYFDTALNAAIIENGITRSVMVASLVYTITTFMPGVQAVEIHIGEETIMSLTPSATFTGAGETIAFENGWMKRSDFSGFLLSDCVLYFANGDGKLQKVYRMVPFHESRNVRTVINQLMLSSQPNDSVEKLGAVLPEGLRDADLIGVAFAEQTLILNFSGNLKTLCEGMDADRERRMIYAIVNSLCELQGVKQVQLLVDGSQPESLAGTIYLPGKFFSNPDIVSP